MGTLGKPYLKIVLLAHGVLSIWDLHDLTKNDKTQISGTMARAFFRDFALSVFNPASIFCSQQNGTFEKLISYKIF
jgi:hypothetical protein